MKQLHVEILARAPTEFFHCQHCEVAFHEVGIGRRFQAEQRSAGLPADLQDEFSQLADWIAELTVRYGDRLQIAVIDVASIEGFFKALRYRAWRYPTIAVNGEVIFTPGRRDQAAASPEADRVALELRVATEQIARRLAS